MGRCQMDTPATAEKSSGKERHNPPQVHPNRPWSSRTHKKGPSAQGQRQGGATVPPLCSALGEAARTPPATDSESRRQSHLSKLYRDLAVELPTGAGKSLIAPLIYKAWRREGATVAVLTENKVLLRPYCC